jgi:DHA1 family tetracycline resistance protein-like MFS transporter
MTHEPRRAAFAFVFVTVLLDMFAIGIIIPVLPKLVEHFVNGNTARAAIIYGGFATAWALMQFLFSPVAGGMSDRFGRRPIILMSNFGLGLDYILMALAPSLGWLLLGRIISGITAASISTAGAYIADVTPPEQRAAKFGMLGAAFGAGFVIGPGLGGLLGSIDPRLPFWVAAGFSLTNALYGLFVLPESLPKEKRSAFSWRRANPVGALRLLRSHRELWGLSWVSFISSLAHAALPNTAVLYLSYRFHWDTARVGLLLMWVGVCQIVVQGFLVGRITKAIGERRAVIIGLFCGIGGFLLQGLATTPWLYVPGIGLMALWGIANPSIQALMSRLVGPTEQGQLQGANGSVLGIASLIGPITFTQTFAMAIGVHADWHVPGAPFLLSAILLAVATVIAMRVIATRFGGVSAPVPEDLARSAQ